MKKILVLALTFILMLSFTGCAMLDYKMAEKSFEAGDYAAAAEVYKALGDYKDSAELAKECDYLTAQSLYDAGDFEAAMTAYEALGDYKDSAELVTKANNALVEQKVLGSWKSKEIDGTELFLSGFADQDLSEYIEIGSFTFYIDAVFNEDGSFTEKTDIDSFMESVNGVKDAIAEGFEKYMAVELEKELTASGQTMDALFAYYGASTVHDLIETVLGMSIEDYISLSFGDEMFEEIADNIKVEGSYTVEDGALILDADGVSEPGEYDLAADTITFLGDPDSDDPGQSLYPIIFLRTEA